MKPIVYIQADANGLPYSVSGETATRGFGYLGYEVRPFSTEELPRLPLTPDTVVVGGMGTVRAALEQLGIRPPLHVTVPAALFPYLGRKVWRTTLNELAAADEYPVFVKPYEDSKLFDGHVVDSAGQLEDLLKLRDGMPIVTRDMPILAQEPITFVSEWRVFVLRGLPIGISHYRGDLLQFPAAGVLRSALGAYRDAPAGYSADFGVTHAGKTVLIEVNDGYALGAIGLAADRYADLLRTRWHEMTARE